MLSRPRENQPAEAQGLAEERRHFPGQAQNAQAVRPVGGDGHFQDHVGELQGLAQVPSYGEVLGMAMRVVWSAETPSSSSARSMPSENMPRSFTAFNSRPWDMVAPGGAKA